MATVDCKGRARRISKQVRLSRIDTHHDSINMSFLQGNVPFIGIYHMRPLNFCTEILESDGPKDLVRITK